MATIKQKITPFLWYDNQALEAAKFYGTIFKNAKILNASPMVVTFELEGQKFMALNGGPQFKFTEAVSLFVECESQGEVDEFWEKLSAGGSKSQCGWLKDKYGLSWQVVPAVLPELLGSADRAKAARAMQAMMGMTKLDIAALQAAADGE